MNYNFSSSHSFPNPTLLPQSFVQCTNPSSLCFCKISFKPCWFWSHLAQVSWWTIWLNAIEVTGLFLCLWQIGSDRFSLFSVVILHHIIYSLNLIFPPFALLDHFFPFFPASLSKAYLYYVLHILPKPSKPQTQFSLSKYMCLLCKNSNTFILLLLLPPCFHYCLDNGFILISYWVRSHLCLPSVFQLPSLLSLSYSSPHMYCIKRNPTEPSACTVNTQYDCLPRLSSCQSPVMSVLFPVVLL